MYFTEILKLLVSLLNFQVSSVKKKGLSFSKVNTKYIQGSIIYGDQVQTVKIV